MGQRRKSREIALQMLYQMEVTGQAPHEALELFYRLVSDEEEEKPDIPVSVRPFAERLVNGVYLHREQLDAMIVAASQNWRIERMSIVDRNVLRIALYEMLYCIEIPPQSLHQRGHRPGENLRQPRFRLVHKRCARPSPPGSQQDPGRRYPSQCLAHGRPGQFTAIRGHEIRHRVGALFHGASTFFGLILKSSLVSARIQTCALIFANVANVCKAEILRGFQQTNFRRRAAKVTKLPDKDEGVKLEDEHRPIEDKYKD